MISFEGDNLQIDGTFSSRRKISPYGAEAFRRPILQVIFGGTGSFLSKYPDRGSICGDGIRCPQPSRGARCMPRMIAHNVACMGEKNSTSSFLSISSGFSILPPANCERHPQHGRIRLWSTQKIPGWGLVTKQRCLFCTYASHHPRMIHLYSSQLWPTSGVWNHQSQ